MHFPGLTADPQGAAELPDTLPLDSRYRDYPPQLQLLCLPSQKLAIFKV